MHPFAYITRTEIWTFDKGRFKIQKFHFVDMLVVDKGFSDRILNIYFHHSKKRQSKARKKHFINKMLYKTRKMIYE